MAPRRAQAERREETMASILDAAEKLFAEHGRDGVTVRMVGAEADVDPPLVHYYFENLEGVYRAVFRRKGDIVNVIRNRRMDEYLAEHAGRLTVDGAFDAFLRPLFETMSAQTEYWANYAAIVGLATSSRSQGRDYMSDAYDATVHRFIDLLMQLAPEVPRTEIYWFYHLLSASLSVTLAQTGRIDNLSRGLCKSTEFMSALQPMFDVFTTGFEALRARHARPSGVKKKASGREPVKSKPRGKQSGAKKTARVPASS